jgi:hypothetical protein
MITMLLGPAGSNPPIVAVFSPGCAKIPFLPIVLPCREHLHYLRHNENESKVYGTAWLILFVKRFHRSILANFHYDAQWERRVKERRNAGIQRLSQTFPIHVRPAQHDSLLGITAIREAIGTHGIRIHLFAGKCFRRADNDDLDILDRRSREIDYLHVIEPVGWLVASRAGRD